MGKRHRMCGDGAVLLLLLLGTASAGTASACPETRAPQARYSSKTAYQLSHDGNVDPEDNVQGCTAVYLWHTLRHGTRYPSAKQIRQLDAKVPAMQARVASNLAAGRLELCPDVRRMLDWTLNATEAQGDNLHVQGERDLLGIASRFKERYPAFFARYPHPDNFTFRSTDTQRTQASAKWYGEGMFKEPINLPKPIPDDPLLKFYAICPAWDAAVDRNATARAEVTAFEEGSAMKAALGRVSRRLGFNDTTLSYDELEPLWESCRYDQAWDPSTEAAWCAAFTEEDLRVSNVLDDLNGVLKEDVIAEVPVEVFEYRADMKYFYVDGYGSPMNLQLGCPLVKDVVDKFSAFERTGGADKSGSMYFTHSTAIHMTLARLGIGRDAQALTATNYEAMKEDRQWTMTRLAPFAANLAFMLYECPRGERYKVRMYVNEKAVPVEGCAADQPLCSWTDFKKRFSAVSESCSLSFCNRTIPSNSASPGGSLLGLTVSLTASLAVMKELLVAAWPR